MAYLKSLRGVAGLSEISERRSQNWIQWKYSGESKISSPIFINPDFVTIAQKRAKAQQRAQICSR